MKKRIQLAACLLLAAMLAACSLPLEQAPTTAPPADISNTPITENAEADRPGLVPLTVGYVTGQAHLLRSGEKTEISKDDNIYQGDQLQTGSDGLIILKQESGKQLHIAENTHIKVSVLCQDDRGETAEFSLEQGNVVSVVNKELGDHDSYEIETPELIMAIRGTIVSVDYDPHSNCSKTVFFEGKGQVSSKTNADVIEVAAGEAAVTSAGKLEYSDLAPGGLNLSEQRFLFDDDYREFLGGEDANITARRLEMILSKKAFIEAKKNYYAAYHKSNGPIFGGNTGNDTTAPLETFTLDNAKDSFLAYHSDAEITVAKREGDVYYIEGKRGVMIYKMKLKTGDGAVVLDLSIDTGRR